MRETCQILLTSNYDASLLSFCDRTNRETVVANVAVHALATTTEGQVPREIAIALVRSTDPIAAAAPGIAERRPAAITSSREEDTDAVRSCNIIAFNAVLRTPCPGAVV